MTISLLIKTMETEATAISRKKSHIVNQIRMVLWMATTVTCLDWFYKVSYKLANISYTPMG